MLLPVCLIIYTASCFLASIVSLPCLVICLLFSGLWHYCNSRVICITYVNYSMLWDQQSFNFVTPKSKADVSKFSSNTTSRFSKSNQRVKCIVIIFFNRERAVIVLATLSDMQWSRECCRHRSIWNENQQIQLANYATTTACRSLGNKCWFHYGTSWEALLQLQFCTVS